QKCAEKISSLQQTGTTLLLVSHSASQVKRLCKSALWIKDGEIVMYDDAEKVSAAYAADCQKQ
ncbi:MAG TPA: teichoic acid ABC transporter ATP-binding protein, partial [Clostridiales bacterium]|nr:teichoic acid ABC transporter ATP-binding protein [Clostridiales bacterium]